MSSGLSLDRRPARRLALRFMAALAGVVVMSAAAPVLAHAAAPWWTLEARSAPTVLQPGQEGQLVLSATDIGDAQADGSAVPIKITDTVPSGLKVVKVTGKTAYNNHELTCETTPGSGSSGETVTCTYGKALPPFEVLEVFVNVQVEAPAGSVSNTVAIEGGQVPSTSVTRVISIAPQATPFGVEQYELTPENEGGSRDTQAGSHPFQLSTILNLNQQLETNLNTGEKVASAPALLKDLQVKLPVGLVGDTNPDAIPQCSDRDFTTIEPNGNTNGCPNDTAIGVAVVSINEPVSFRATHRVVPVFSLAPAPGEPARFGFEVVKVTVVLDTSVLTGGDYSVVASVKNASQGAQVLGSQLSLWGEPGDESHDQSRGWSCLINGENASLENVTHSGCAPAPRLTKAFLSLPTSCAAAWKSTVLADSWLEPGARQADGSADESDPRWKGADRPSNGPHQEGCDALPFAPSIGVEPETHAASSPSGLTVDVHEPQTSTLELGGLAASAVKETIVSLPEGVLLSPSAANGLEGCSTGLAGYTGKTEFEPGTPTNTFTRQLPSPLEPGANFCPNGSKVGVVHIKTPDLPNEIEGGVYLAEQNANPFGSLFAMYIIAQDPVSSVTVKLAGEVSLNSSTGQITTSFKNTPQLPFEDLKLELFGGPRASISTPSLCGNYTTNATFVPWSGNPAVSESSTFAITSGADGSGCSNPLPLTAGLSAGSTNKQAGAFTPFELTLSHRDGDQAPNSLSVHLPPGLAAMLSSVELCPEPQASSGDCPAGSLIGHASATAGLGSQPFTETGGKVFITGPYNGAPFGLTIVIPTTAGPFDFGNVVTRSSLLVDRNTAAVTINSVLPTMVNTATYQTGVPVQLKQIHVVVDRPEFQFNPTNCNPMSIEAKLGGSQGGSASASTPFQVANCTSLPFKPTLTASTKGNASKANGAALVIKVLSSPGQANIAKTKLVLPVTLPSRLTTIQKACLDTVFEANPAGCAEGSNIGYATVYTPVLREALSGPAYLVSHGNAAFPDVEFVLSNKEGIELILDGQTDIKKGVTTSTFNAVPDAPVSSFEAVLPEGPHSALTSNVPESKRFSLCGQKLVIPTTITGQNGAVIQQQTKVPVEGCKAVKASKVKKLSRAQKLRKALRACKKKKSKSKRKACEKQAHKKYGAKKAHKKKHA
jgi:hypothetical protein